MRVTSWLTFGRTKLERVYASKMLSLLTPSKTMDFSTPLPVTIDTTAPLFFEESEQLRYALRRLSVSELREHMKISISLAQVTRANIQQSSTPEKPALWAYVGDVYKGFRAQTLDVEGAKWAQQHLLIPSGLYGLLRPFDRISAYRLEMKTALVVGSNRQLYEFWGSKLGQYMRDSGEREILILSSFEYAKAITPYLAPDTQVVTPAFIDCRSNGQETQVAIYNKMMRGVMARWIVDQRIDSLDAIVSFSGHGYRYSPERSTPDRPVYFRSVMTPLIFA